MSDDLCEDLFFDIFSRLPPKSLLRFRSLSKWSYACIGSPDFIRLHTLRSQNKVMLIHRELCFHDCENQCFHDCGNNGTLEDVTYFYTLHSEDQLPNNRNIYKTQVQVPFVGYGIVGSCNGILFLYERRDDIISDSISLWNPSIRRKLIIDVPPLRCYPRTIFYPDYDDIDVINDSLDFGFGYDSVIDDYKILIITKPTSFVYTMKTQTWREIASPSDVHVDSNQCHFNGALYYNVTSGSHHPCIMRFDLSSEVFTMIESPQLNASWETRVVTVINGRLAVISQKDEVCRIWVRSEEECNNTVVADASWSVAFKLNARDYEGTRKAFQLTAINALLLDRGSFHGIMVIDLETHLKSRLVDMSDSSYIYGMSMCTESLELLGMGTSC